jgi:hypothetical protein
VYRIKNLKKRPRATKGLDSLNNKNKEDEKKEEEEEEKNKEEEEEEEKEEVEGRVKCSLSENIHQQNSNQGFFFYL